MAAHPNQTFASAIRQAHWVRQLLRLLPMRKLRQQMRVRKGFQWFRAECKAVALRHLEIRKALGLPLHHNLHPWLAEGFRSNPDSLQLVGVIPEWDSQWVHNPACSPQTHH